MNQDEDNQVQVNEQSEGTYADVAAGGALLDISSQETEGVEVLHEEVVKMNVVTLEAEPQSNWYQLQQKHYMELMKYDEMQKKKFQSGHIRVNHDMDNATSFQKNCDSYDSRTPDCQLALLV